MQDDDEELERKKETCQEEMKNYNREFFISLSDLFNELGAPVT